MIDAPLALAFTAGLVATLNPCGFVMLPAYLSWFVGTADDEARPDVASRLARALAVSGVVSATFLVVFTAVGLLFSAGALVIVEVIPWLALVVGAGVVVLGVAMFRGWKPAVALPQLSGGVHDRGAGGAVVFGLSYAIASLSCTLPVFLAVVAGTVTRTDLASGVATFVAYGAGMSLVLVAVAVAVAVTRTALVRSLRLASRRMDRVAAALLVVAGLYVVGYWAFTLAAPPARPTEPAGSRWPRCRCAPWSGCPRGPSAPSSRLRSRSPWCWGRRSWLPRRLWHTHAGGRAARPRVPRPPANRPCRPGPPMVRARQPVFKAGQSGRREADVRRTVLAVVAANVARWWVAALCLAALGLRPPVSLRRYEVSTDWTPAEAFEAFDRKLSATAAVESSRPGEVIAQFEGHAGPFSYRTREVVRFTDSAVTFEHIEGPFRSCAERFVIASNASSTTVAHEGTFTMRGGLAGWLLGLIVVRPFFERLVADELEAMASHVG